MLNRKQIIELFKELNTRLQKKKVVGEIGICGGAVMCLVFQARQATKDIDAIFTPTQEIREIVESIALDLDLPPNWLNDAAKSFFYSDPPRENVWEGDYLRVWAPRADYMLAMKCVSARFDTHDRDDVIFLIKYLELNTTEAVFQIIAQYYPRQMIPIKTQFFVEEILQG